MSPVNQAQISKNGWMDSYVKEYLKLPQKWRLCELLHLFVLLTDSLVSTQNNALLGVMGLSFA